MVDILLSPGVSLFALLIAQVKWFIFSLIENRFAQFRGLKFGNKQKLRNVFVAEKRRKVCNVSLGKSKTSQKTAKPRLGRLIRRPGLEK